MQRAFFFVSDSGNACCGCFEGVEYPKHGIFVFNEMANLERQARRPRLRLREIDPMGACIIVFDAALTPWRVKSVPKAIQRSQG